jgi:hypothetical protein
MMGREYAWAERVGWALASVEQTLLRLLPQTDDQNGRDNKPNNFEANDRLNGLGQEPLLLAERCKGLRRAVQNLAQPFTTPPRLDLGSILEGGRKIMADLHRLLENKANLELQGAGTDKTFPSP